MPTTTFDSANKSANFALSGGNLVATSSGVASVAATRVMTGLTYFEMTATTLTGTLALGFVNRAYNMASGTILGTDNNGLGFKSSGAVVLNNATLATIFTYTGADVIGVAFNPQLRKVWFTKNGITWNNDIIANQDPANSIGGIDYSTIAQGPNLPAASCSATGAVWTANFSGAFTYTAPTGFVTPDTVQASGKKNVGQFDHINLAPVFGSEARTQVQGRAPGAAVAAAAAPISHGYA
jgi:hypothetical protein